MNNELQEIRTLVDVWLAPQEQLPKVLRWKQFVCKADGGQNKEEKGTRPQNTLQHSHSLGVLADIVIARLLPYRAINDPFLLSTCVRVHDHGEGEVGYDTLYMHKSVGGDVDEYVAFRKRIEPLDAVSLTHLNRAFLLQFCLKKEDEILQFPEEAQEVMRILAMTRRREALLFGGLEHFDYVLYAAEQHFRLGHVPSMVEVARYQLAHLRHYVKVIPGYGEQVWTPELDSWLETFAPHSEVV